MMIVRQRIQSPTVDQVFNQLTRSLMSATPTSNGTGRRQPFIQTSWVNDEYVLSVDLPGVRPDLVSVEVVGDRLRLVVGGDEFATDRSLRLHAQLDPSKITANHVDGRLTVRIGKIDAPEPRRIEVTHDEAIEAVASDEVAAHDVAAVDAADDSAEHSE